MQQSYRRTTLPKCDFNKVACNFIEITILHGYSPVDLLHIFRKSFPRNTSGRLPLSLPLNPFHLIVSNYKYLFSIISCTSKTTFSRNNFHFCCFTLVFYLPFYYAMFWSLCNVSIMQCSGLTKLIGVSLCFCFFKVDSSSCSFEHSLWKFTSIGS